MLFGEMHAAGMSDLVESLSNAIDDPNLRLFHPWRGAALDGSSTTHWHLRVCICTRRRIVHALGHIVTHLQIVHACLLTDDACSPASSLHLTASHIPPNRLECNCKNLRDRAARGILDRNLCCMPTKVFVAKPRRLRHIV